MLYSNWIARKKVKSELSCAFVAVHCLLLANSASAGSRTEYVGRKCYLNVVA